MCVSPPRWLRGIIGVSWGLAVCRAAVVIVLGQGCWIRVFGAMETRSKTCLKLSGAQESHPQEDHVITETDEIFVL